MAMRMRSLVVLTTVAAFLPLLAARRSSTPTPQWEYLVQFGEGSGIKPDRHRTQLDSLGHEGWELTAVVGSEFGGNTGSVVLYLKRPLPVPP